MIVARGLGLGRLGAICAAGLGMDRGDFTGGGSWGTPQEGKPRKSAMATAAQDDRDLAELLPALIGALNANRRH